jgi:hypothetical protein
VNFVAPKGLVVKIFEVGKTYSVTSTFRILVEGLGPMIVTRM